MGKFKLKSKFNPSGDQPEAIKNLTSGIKKGIKHQTLLGVTGSGKTFTVANVIEKINKPTLVISHNKTLAAQLCNEFREFFPDSAVEYFVSYYDYYQPEAYIPGTDTYIEKETQINAEIERLRHACTQALLTRKDVIVVASVSAIYGLGSPEEYKNVTLHLSVGDNLNRTAVTKQLVYNQFERTSADLQCGQFRLRGQTLEVIPINEDRLYRMEITNKIESIEIFDPLTKKHLGESYDIWLFPAKHYVINDDLREKAFKAIRAELKDQLKKFKKEKKILESERLSRRVKYDLEMIANVGYCSGIENYSRPFDGREEGEPPYTLLDYFRESDPDFLTIIDESHVTLPQIRGMYHGDRARKETLVSHGFRLPSAKDNRPLKFPEFEKRVNQAIYISATPAEEEMGKSSQIVEQIVRPTGLIDPEVILRHVTPQNHPERSEGSLKLKKSTVKGSLDYARDDNNLSQIDDLIVEIEKQVKKGEKTLVTTLTKTMAEDLTEYLDRKKIKVKYLHSEIDTIERIEIITDLRKGKIDVIVGVNLLREGLDIPEVSLVAILDADKEGFLRNETSLVQTIGRAARNVNGRVIMYADKITGSIKEAVRETERRRKIQIAYNQKHGITPQTIKKNISNILEEFGITNRSKGKTARLMKGKSRAEAILATELEADTRPIEEIINDKEKQMRQAAKDLQFELAAIIRDEIHELKKKK